MEPSESLKRKLLEASPKSKAKRRNVKVKEEPGLSIERTPVVTTTRQHASDEAIFALLDQRASTPTLLDSTTNDGTSLEQNSSLLSSSRSPGAFGANDKQSLSIVSPRKNTLGRPARKLVATRSVLDYFEASNKPSPSSSPTTSPNKPLPVIRKAPVSSLSVSPMVREPVDSENQVQIQVPEKRRAKPASSPGKKDSPKSIALPEATLKRERSARKTLLPDSSVFPSLPVEPVTPSEASNNDSLPSLPPSSSSPPLPPVVQVPHPDSAIGILSCSSSSPPLLPLHPSSPLPAPSIELDPEITSLLDSAPSLFGADASVECQNNVNHGFMAEVLQAGRELLSSSSLCDAELVVGTAVFPIHRLLLAGASRYFKDRFLSGLWQAQPHLGSDRSSFVVVQDDSLLRVEVSSSTTRFVFKNLKTSDLAAAVGYIYSGRIVLTPLNLFPLLLFASQFKIEGLQLFAIEYLRRRISKQTVVAILRIATVIHVPSLLSAAQEFFLREFAEVSKEESFSNLPPDLLEDLLKREELSVSHEVGVFDALCAYYKNHSGPLPPFHQLFPVVRLALIPPQELAKMSNHELLQNDPVAMCHASFVRERLMQPYLRDEQIDLASILREKTKLDEESFLYIGGLSESKGVVHHVSSFSPFRWSWKNKSHLCVPRRHFGVAVLGTTLYVFGGVNGHGQLIDSAELFNEAENKWTTFRSTGEKIATLNKPREFFSFAVHEDVAYVMGGRVGHGVTNSVEVFDVEENTWKVVQSMPTGRFGACAVESGGLIYVFGGITSMGNVTTTMDVYNPVTCVWSKGSSMNHARYRACAVEHGKFLYVLGGLTSHDSVMGTMEVFNTESCRWEVGPHMAHPRFDASAVVCEHLIFVIGGLSTKAKLDKELLPSEVFNTLTNSWHLFPSPPSLRSGASAISLITPVDLS